MDAIFNDIESALKANVYYAAIALALSIPDVCASLQHPIGHVKGSNKSGYIKWFTANLSGAYPLLTGNDIYSLRSGVVHNGRFGAGNFARVLFTVPNSQGNVFHNNIINDALNLDAVQFCKNFVAAARSWLTHQKTDKNVERNLDRVVQFRPAGLAPYMVGMPLIA
jgi:hypothetical protein